MKAQFYSMIAILITLPILAFLTSYAAYYQSMGYGVVDRVISDQLHQLSASIEMDTMKAMEITGRRALLAATNFVINSGSPLEDARANITTLMLTGNLNGTFVSAFVLGLVMSLTARYWSQAAETMVFIVMAIMLIIKPIEI